MTAALFLCDDLAGDRVVLTGPEGRHAATVRRVQVGVVLERIDSAEGDQAPETIRAVSGGSIVTLVGQPSQLMLYAHGRTTVAEIKLVGEPEAIEILNAAELRT